MYKGRLMAKTSYSCSTNEKVHFQFHNRNRQINCKQKTYNIAKQVFYFLYQNQTALAVAMWSYVFIEVGVVASEIAFGQKQISDLDSCRNILCNQWNENIDTSHKAPPHIEARCNASDRKNNSLYFFTECMNDLCEYMTSIGKKIYACTSIFNKSQEQSNSAPITDSTEEESNFTLELWNKLCPKKKFRNKNNLRELAYLNKCIKKICRHSTSFKITLDKSVMDWCHNLSVDKLYKLLKKLTKLLDQSQKKKPDESTQANIIGTLVTAVTGVIVGVTTVIGTIITCKAAKAASSMTRIIPSLTSGLQNIIIGATETTKAIIEAGGAAGGEAIPMETLTVMSEVSEAIEHSLSYYSAEETLVESGTGNLGAKPVGTNVGSIAGSIITSVGTNVGATAINTGSVAASIVKSIVPGIAVSVRSPAGEILKSDRGEKANSKESTSIIDRIEKIQQEYLNDFIFGPLEGHNITERQTFRLKYSLSDWKNAFCYYQFPRNVFCRLPLPRHLFERIIMIAIENLQKVFSKNAPGLCYSFWKDLWCNWGKFFDILSIDRNVIANNNTCPWDQFILTVEESSDNLYQIASKIRQNGCYNETVMIRV